MIRIAGVALAALVSTTVFAQGQHPRCAEMSASKNAIAALDGSWTELSSQQLAFMDGIYAMAPETPPGLPYGDKAILATIPGKQGAIVFFLDGDQACTPIPIPPQLLDMLHDIAKGVIHHEKDGA